MIDGIELGPFHELQKVRELHCEHAIRLKRDGDAGDEIIEIRNMSEHVVARQQICRVAIVHQFFRGLASKKGDFSGNAFGFRDPRDIVGRLDAEDRNIAFNEILQQIPVIAGHLQDPAFRTKAKAVDHGLAILFRVRRRAKCAAIPQPWSLPC